MLLFDVIPLLLSIPSIFSQMYGKLLHFAIEHRMAVITKRDDVQDTIEFEQPKCC